MMNALKNIYRIWVNELRLVFRDQGVMIFFFLLPLTYPVVYTLIYNTEVVHKIPVTVVDDCRTSQSREMTRMLGATSAVDVVDIAADMGEARRMMAEKKCYAVVHIPENFSRSIGRGEPVKVPVFIDMSLLLRYRTLGFALTDVQLQLGEDVRAELIDAAGGATVMTTGTSVKNEAFMLGDQEQGFASFIIPGIIILILQQSMVLGITMLAGGAAARRRRNGGVDPLAIAAPFWQTISGKTLAYLFLYIPGTLYILHYLPEMFSLPHTGSPSQYLPFILPMLIASAFLGLLIGQTLIKERESSFIVVVFTSVVFLFLSGLTWPRYAMSGIWLAVSNLVPATHGVEGFVRINSNSGTLAENSSSYLWMWGLAAGYLLLNLAVYWLKNKKVEKKS